MNTATSDFEKMKQASQELKDKIDHLQSKVADIEDTKKTDALKIIEYLKTQDKVIDQLLKQMESENKATAGDQKAKLRRMLNDVDNAYRNALSGYH